MYGYEWTEEYGIFRLTIDAKLQKEIRPVFREELDFFGMDQYWDYPKDTTAPLLWAEGIRRYVMNGVCIAEAQGGGFYSKPVIQRNTEERLQLKPIDTKRLYEVNKALMLSLEQKAIAFIQEQHERYLKEGFAFVCAFSGGKDSLVLLDLCAKALAPEDFYVVFSNTGMELSDTIEAVEKAKRHWSQLRFEEAKCHMDATETWEEFGPPAQRLRWCCSVHKSVPTVLKIREITKRNNGRIVVYDGVRAEESVKRAKYNEVVEGAKNSSQVNCHPILRWNLAELFCFLFHEDILLNNCYRNGLFRVGCMVCPMASSWNEGIQHSLYAEEISPFVEKVEAYATELKNEKQAKKYIEEGGWKARVGGHGLTNGGNRVKETVSGNQIVFSMSSVKQNITDVLPILGTIVEQDGNVGIIKYGGRLLNYRIKANDKALTLGIFPFSVLSREDIYALRGVCYKTAYCIGCRACVVQCPTGAFIIQPNGKIMIRENRCVHCKKCLTHCDRGCLVADSLKVREGGFNSMKSLDPYRQFGLRQEWLAHFMQEGTNCFSMNILGSVQYVALKAWLKDANIIESEKDGKTNTLIIKPLGEKLIPMGPYNPFVWAIIWANLAYNSAICGWYCRNVEVGSVSNRDDLVFMIGEVSSEKNRQNAVNALFSTFRDSPIGSALGQGIPIEKTYLRAGWEMPHAVALLYTIYLYAEHACRRSFTFSELVTAHNNPDATGISPSDIFGIDVKAFRDQVQGLAIQFPKYIRVSFISNLDNIILEDFNSLDILDLAEE